MTPTNEAIASWIIENRFALAGFHDAYERLSYEGRCDSAGGMEYHRVLAEWIEQGSPEHIDEFIVQRANIV